MPNFSDVAAAYLRGRVVTLAHCASVRRVAARCGEMTQDRLNLYICERLKTASPVTVRTERSILLSLWKFAYDSSMVEAMPRGIARVKARKPPTRAWTLDEVRAALDGTRRHRGRRLRSGASREKFLRAWIYLAYESGARMSDIFSFSRSNLEDDILRWVQSKTGDAITKILSPECLSACRDILEGSPDGRIVGWCCGRRQACRAMRQHLEACGLSGSSKWFRRSGATHIEIEQPGRASMHLGHRTASLAAQAYLDWGQIRQRSPTPPRLADAGDHRGG
jgi:hypothetical protein